MFRVTSYPGRWLVRLGYAAWVVSVAYVLACLAAPSMFGGCELTPGSSVFGDATRSWLPPGTTCTYDLSGYGLSENFVTRPSPVRLVVVAMALTGFPLLQYLRRLLKRPTLVDA